MIVVQRVVTEWTKRSRGAPGAVRRNAVDEAFPLPAADRAERADHIKVWVHQVVATERHDFAARQEANGAALPDAGPLRLDGSAGIHLEMIDGLLVVTGVTNVWCQCFTVFPQRKEGVVLRLEAGQWGRWRLNFRFWEDFNQSEWMYQKWVVNVGYLPQRPLPDLFQATKPAHVTDDMVQLTHPTRWKRRSLDGRRIRR